MVHCSLPGCIAFTMWRTYLEFRFSTATTRGSSNLEWSGVASRSSSLVFTDLIYHFRSPLSRYHRQTVDHEHSTTTLSYRPGYASDLFLHTPKTGGLIKEYCKSLSRHLSSSPGSLLGLVSDYEAEFNNTPPPWPETFCLPEREYSRYGLLVGAWAIDHFN